jgi:hypothetical protein
MNPKYARFFLLIGLCLSIVRCGGYKASPVGAEMFQGQNPDMERLAAFTPASSDTSYRISRACGGSPLLFAGNDQGLEALTYVVFDTATITGSVIKATLSFQVLPYPVAAASPADIQILPTGSKWDEGSMTWDTRIPAASETPLFEVQASLSDSSTVIDLDVTADLAKSFVTTDTTVERTGIMIRTASPGGFFKLYGRESSASTSLIPHLTLITESDTLTVTPVKDTFVSSSDRSGLPDRYWIQDGIAERILMRFNLTGIPPEATINRAMLVLRADPESSFPDAASAFYLSAVPLADSVWTLPGVALDSTWTASAKVTADSAALILTSLVQKWTSGTQPNCGLMLRGVLETTDPAGRAFFSSSADSAGIPRLRVFYSVPPSGRY